MMGKDGSRQLQIPEDFMSRPFGNVDTHPLQVIRKRRRFADYTARPPGGSTEAFVEPVFSERFVAGAGMLLSGKQPLRQ